MNRASIGLAGILVVVGAGIARFAQASESVVCGRSLGSQFIEEVHIPCPANSVCFGMWTRWALHVDSTVNGPKVPDQIKAAVILSSSYTPKAESMFRVFTVAPIEDPDKRKLLGAEFRLLKWSDDKDGRTCDGADKSLAPPGSGM